MFSKARSRKKLKAPMLWIKIVTYAELTWLLEKYSLMNFKTAFKNKNKMFQCRKYKVKSFSLRVMDF